MRSLSIDQARKTLNSTFNHKSQMATLHTTMHSTMDMTLDVKEQISNKYRTFATWNYKHALSKRKKSVELNNMADHQTDSNNMVNALLSYMEHLKKKNQEKKGNKKKEIKIEELQGIKDERRERLKKVQNPLQIVQHFISKQGYNPTQEENVLLDRFIKLKDFVNTIQPFDLQLILKKCYKIMNVSVDLNQMKFLIGTILMTADICFQAKEFVRALHFYTQAVIAATCTNMFSIKVQCFRRIGLICMEINEPEKATIFFKKALQYAWKIKNIQSELRLYDLIGESYHVRGNNRYALYYHNRSIQGQYESNSSAIKRISQEMLNEFDKTLNNSQKQNISKLFIEYLNLPITNFFQVKPPELTRVYTNYIKGQSPRKNRQHKEYQFSQFKNIKFQLRELLENSPEFQSELPNPDIQRNFVAMHKFGKPRKQIDFEQSNQYHKLTGVKIQQIDRSLLKLPLDDQVSRAIADKQNPRWWEDLIIKIKREKEQKIGSLRTRVWNTHKSHHKYPEQRKRATSLKNEKISESINMTILNIIDPIKQ